MVSVSFLPSAEAEGPSENPAKGEAGEFLPAWIWEEVAPVPAFIVCKARPSAPSLGST